MMENFYKITLILVAIVAIPIGIYFLIKSELRKRSSVSLLEIIVVILLAVILWFAAIISLYSGGYDSFNIFFTKFGLLVMPMFAFYVIILKNRNVSDTPILDSCWGLMLFYCIVSLPAMEVINWLTKESTKEITKEHEEIIISMLNGPFKVWHALYLFILAWFIKHYFYGKKEERTIKIAPQTWCRKNLDVSTYRNGDDIPQVQDAAKWANLETGAWCYYENESDNGIVYGKLYNWYAVNDPRGLAPIDYYIPSGDDWTALTNSIMAKENFKGKQMKSKSGWENNGNGNNSSGFAGLPGGFRDSTGDFKDIGAKGRWWSSDGSMSYSLFANDGNVHLRIDEMTIGFSVRCLKD